MFRMRFRTALLFVAGAQLLAEADTRLADAARGGDRTAVRTLLAKKADVNAAQADGTTALQWAAQNDDLELAGMLLKAGADVKAQNRYGVGALAMAVSNGSAAMAERLIRAGADANAEQAEGETALMTAARMGSLETVRLLLGHDAKVNTREKAHGETALMWAAAEGHTAVVETLIEHGAEVNAHASAAGYTPSNGGYLPQTYLPAGSFSALTFAVRGGHLDSAKLLLDKGADVKETLPNGATPLTIAILNAHYELAALLLENGADPNADKQGWTPLHQLVWARDPNRHFNLPPAIATGRIDSLHLALLLLERGADPNARMSRQPIDGFRNWMNRVGATPLLLAAKAQDAPLMRLLKEHGADPSIQTNDHTTVLMAAAGIGYWPAESHGTEEDALEAVKYALELGGDVNAANDAGFTALHGAAVQGANSLVQLLVDRGAKLDARTKKDNWTALDIANGVFIANTFKVMPHTAVLLRKLMGLPSAGG